MVRAGRSFLRRLIDLSKLAKELDHFVRLNRDARSDLEWWFQFARKWNDISIMYQSNRDKCQITVVSDSSGKWGCGAFCNEKWFQLQWPASWGDFNITTKELAPIVLAAVV